MGLHKVLSASTGSGILLVSLAAQSASPYPPLPGSYRPTEGEVKTTTTPQFNPSSYRSIPTGNFHPNAPQVTYPPPPGYNNNQYNMPGFNINPGNMMNSMFNSKSNNNLPYGYPAPPLSGNVAPVYDPPLPSADSGWNNYGYQPQSPMPSYSNPQPAAPQYWQQPAVNTGNNYPQTPLSTQSSYPVQKPTATSNTAPSGYSAPRPFSNPQETGNAFMQRQGTPDFGHSDSRFRPPQLKGTP